MKGVNWRDRPEGEPIPAILSLRVLLRSYLIQGAWNFERMQNLGFCFAMAPALKMFYAGKEELKAALTRHLEFFNTHPYLAAAIIGASLRLEADVSQGRLKADQVRSFKAGLMGGYGAIGDSFFWASFRPLASVVGVLLALNGVTLAPLYFLIFYNLVHLGIRNYIFVVGYRQGAGVAGAIRSLDFPGLTRKARVAGVLFCALATAAVSQGVMRSLGMGWAHLAWVGPIGVVALVFWLLGRGARVGAVVAAALGLVFAAGLVL